MIKRFVITIGDSRVGKSTSARLLLDLYLKQKLTPRVYYHGHRYKLAEYKNYFDINQLGFSRGDSDSLLIDLERGDTIDVVLTDMPGQNFREFTNFEKDVSLVKCLELLGYRTTFLHPISHRKECINDYIHEVIDYFGDRADYVIVKNQYFGRDFLHYERSEVKINISALRGTEVVLGELNQSLYEVLEEANLTYTLATESNLILSQLQKSILFHWITNFHSLIASNIVAAEYLGLSNALALFEQMDAKI